MGQGPRWTGLLLLAALTTAGSPAPVEPCSEPGTSLCGGSLTSVTRELDDRDLSWATREDVPEEADPDLVVVTAMERFPRRALDFVLTLGAVVPDVVGTELSAAAVEVAEHGLTPITGSREDDAADQVVLAQGLEPGTLVPLLTRMDLKAATGVRVPDVTGLAAEEARTVAEDSGLTFALEPAGDGRREEVGSQTPEAGSLVLPGATLTAAAPFVVVSPERSPPAPAQATVPDLAGLGRDQATAALASVGLLLGEVGDRDPGAVVVSQDPAPGEQTRAGSLVAAEFRVLPATVLVPDLSGLDPTEAAARLAALGLGLAGSTTEGSVVRQSPPAGTTVPSGSTVLAVFETGSPGVPWVAGAAVLGVLVAGSALARVRLRRRRDQRWERRHVDYSWDPGPPPSVASRPLSPDAVSVTLAVRQDRGSQTLEEVRR